MPDKELTGLTPLAADFFEADPGFRTLIESLSPPDQKKRLPDRLSAFSQKVSGRWDDLARETVLNYDGPRLEPYDRVGIPIDKVWLPPPVRQLRREVVEAGVFENSSPLELYAKVA